MGIRRYSITGGAPPYTGSENWAAQSTINLQSLEQIYLQPPNTPNAFDDEFNAGSPDLSERGWTFINRDANQPMVRVGDVYPYEYAWKAGVGAMTKLQYRSRIQNGRLALQLPTDVPTEWALYKPITLATAAAADGGILWASFGSSRVLSVAGAMGNTNIQMWGNAAGFPDAANRIYHEVTYNYPSTILSWQAFNGGVQTTLTQTLGDTSPADMFAILSTLSMGTKFAHFDTQTGADASTAFLPGPTWPQSNRLAYAGFGFFMPNPANDRLSAGIRYLDFARLRTGNMQNLCASSQWLYP